MMDCHSNKLEVLRGFRKVVPTLGSKHIRAVRDEHGTDVDGACGTESRELAVGHGFPERPNVNHGLFGDCEEKMQGGNMQEVAGTGAATVTTIRVQRTQFLHWILEIHPLSSPFS